MYIGDFNNGTWFKAPGWKLYVAVHRGGFLLKSVALALEPSHKCKTENAGRENPGGQWRDVY